MNWASRKVLGAAPPPMLLDLAASGVALEVLSLAMPIFAQVIFDKVIIHHSLSTLHVLAIGMMGLVVAEALLVYGYARHVHHLSAAVDLSLMRPASLKLLGLPLTYFQGRSRGEIAADVRAIGEIRQFLSASSVSALIDSFFLMVVLGLIALYSTRIAALVALAILALGLLSAVLRPVVKRCHRQTSDARDRDDALVMECLQNMATIKMNSLEPVWARRWDEVHGHFLEKALRTKHVAAIEDTCLRVFQRVLVVAVLWVGAYEAVSGTLTFGQLIACYMFTVRILGPSTRLYQIATGLVQIQKATERITDLLGQPSEEPAGGKAVPFTPGEISFQGVAVSYPAMKSPLLEDVSFRIRVGQIVGITGRSGCGKSTLARLLQCHMQPDAGIITVGGTVISHCDRLELRRGILVVSHDASMFVGSIRENIAGFDADPDELLVRRCCQVVEVDAMLADLSITLDTPLDEGGARLSSGQRQRIALARALYARPHVLVVDEATNALDESAEAAILARMSSEFADRILIVISHRASALRQASVVLDVGRGGVETRKQSTLRSERVGATRG